MAKGSDRAATGKVTSSKRVRQATTSDGSEEDGYSTSSSYAPSAIDVSFNYVAPTEIDFMALKRLIQQLYHTHATELDLGALADRIIQQGRTEAGSTAIGTVVKVEDDEDGDPFAFASVVDLGAGAKDDADAAAQQTLLTYYGKVLTASKSAAASKLLASIQSTSNRVVQIFHERMINLPPQIMPPLYRMLFEEMQGHPSLAQASHLLFFSRTFSTEAWSDGEEEQEQDKGASGKSKAAAAGKKVKRTKPVNEAITKLSGPVTAADADEVGLFHPEDALIAKHALFTASFRFPAVKDSDDSFNAPMFGRIVLVKNDEAVRQALLKDITEAFALPA